MGARRSSRRTRGPAGGPGPAGVGGGGRRAAGPGESLMRRAELLFAVVVLLLLSAAWGLDRLIPAHGAATAPARQPAGSFGLLSQAWYCPLPGSQGLASTVSTVDLGRSGVHLRRSRTGAPAEADVGPGVLTAVPAAPAPATAPATAP